MDNGLRLVTAAAIVALVSASVRAAPPEAAAAAAAALIVDSLVVRIYDNAGVLAGERSRAISRADAILGRADIDVEWIECPAPQFGRPARRCGTPPARAELVVRLVNAPRDDDQGTKWLALGNSLIDTTTGIGTLATIFVDRVARLAGEARIDRATMLGRAIAHEIGHLILGTNEHSSSGIMRETWTAQQLTSNSPGDWHFLPAQRERLRHARLNGIGMPAVAAEEHRAAKPGG